VGPARRAQEAIDRDRLALALEPDLLARGEREGVLRELIRRIADQDLARHRPLCRREAVLTVSPVTA